MTSNNRLVALCCGLALVAAVTPAAAERQIYVYEIPLETVPAGFAASGSVLQFDFHTLRPERIARNLEASGILAEPTAPGVVRITIGQQSVLGGAVSADDSLATFLIDYDEPVVAALIAQLGPIAPDDAGIAQLTAMTDLTLGNKGFARGFDIASTVARTGQGDCTEHAVLLAALARGKGLPARVVTGVAIVTGEDTPAAYGHAWTEIYADGQWTLADATRVGAAPGSFMHYLPLGTIEDEGPGFALSLIGLADLKPSRITALHSVAASPPIAPDR